MSGYTTCPCCGYDTVSDDVNEPELCSDCEDAECSPEGDEQGGPGCPAWEDEPEVTP